MSRVAVCALVLAGCNQVFGLDPTEGIDAGLVPDMLGAESGHVSITRLRVDVAGLAPGAPTSDETPITNARIRAGLLTGELVVLQPDPEDETRFLAPAVVLEEPARLEVTLVDGSPPVEIAWPEDAKDIYLVVPEIGHAGGDDLGPTEQWAVTLTNGPATVAQGAVLSTGAWLSWQGGADDNSLDVLWSNGTSHSDARVRPSNARGDYNIALQLAAADMRCSRRPIGYGVFLAPALGFSATATNEFWFTGPTETTTLSATWSVFADLTTAGVVLDDLATGINKKRFVLGYAPRPDLATRAWRIGPLTPTRIVGPGVVPLLECDPEMMGQPEFTPVPELQETYGELAYGSITWSRVVLGPAGPGAVTADSGFELVAPVVGTDVEPRSATLSRDVAFPSTRLSGDPADHEFIELCSNANCIPLTSDGVEPARSSDTDVRFVLENGKRIDFWSVTLVRVLPSGLVPVRMFITQTPLEAAPTKYEASFDLSDDTQYPAGTYLFIIRGHLGWPSARFGDFKTHRLPYQISTTSTHTFELP